MPPHQRPRQVPAAPRSEDSAELIECILCVTTERRDVLRRILLYVDGSLCNGRRCPALALPLTGMERFGARPIDLSPKYDFYRTLLDRNNSTVWI